MKQKLYSIFLNGWRKKWWIVYEDENNKFKNL